jgi:hypothetical protein
LCMEFTMITPGTPDFRGDFNAQVAPIPAVVVRQRSLRCPLVCLGEERRPDGAVSPAVSPHRGPSAGHDGLPAMSRHQFDSSGNHGGQEYEQRKIIKTMAARGRARRRRRAAIACA